MLGSSHEHDIHALQMSTDMWNRHKNPYDYADIFQEQAGQWIEHMEQKIIIIRLLLVDRNEIQV